MKAILLSLVIVLAAASVRAADPSPAEARLREALRNTMLQLRTAQNDLAAAQASKAEFEKKSQDQEAQIKLLTTHGEEDRAASAKKIEALNTQVAELAKALDDTKNALAKSRADHQAAMALAQKTEVARKQLEEEKIVLTRKTEDQKTKNAEMYKLGREILLRYEKFGLGDALGAKEPFIGTTRVKLESFVQDFQDKLTDQKIKPETKPESKPE